MRINTTNRFLTATLTIMALSAIIVSGCQKTGQPPAGSGLTDGKGVPAPANVSQGATISDDARSQMQAAQQKNAADRAAHAPPAH